MEDESSGTSGDFSAESTTETSGYSAYDAQGGGDRSFADNTTFEFGFSSNDFSSEDDIISSAKYKPSQNNIFELNENSFQNKNFTYKTPVNNEAVRQTLFESKNNEVLISTWLNTSDKKDNKMSASKALFTTAKTTAGLVKSSYKVANLPIPQNLKNVSNTLTGVNAILYLNNYYNAYKNDDFRSAFAVSFYTGLGMVISLGGPIGVVLSLPIVLMSQELMLAEKFYDLQSEISMPDEWYSKTRLEF